MDSRILARIDTIAQEGIDAQAYPGCHVLILKDGYPVYNKCFGTFTYDGSRKVKENDLYDLASLSKVTGTLLAVMKLYDEGKFGLLSRICCFTNLVCLLTGLSIRKLLIRSHVKEVCFVKSMTGITRCK